MELTKKEELLLTIQRVFDTVDQQNLTIKKQTNEIKKLKSQLVTTAIDGYSDQDATLLISCQPELEMMAMRYAVKEIFYSWRLFGTDSSDYFFKSVVNHNFEHFFKKISIDDLDDRKILERVPFATLKEYLKPALLKEWEDRAKQLEVDKADAIEAARHPTDESDAESDE